jgi:hypothetical protein
MKARATYSVMKWEESAYEQILPDMKMTKASVEYDFKGDCEGRARVEYLMHYTHFDEKDQHDSVAEYVGLIRFEGTLGGKSGSFVMKDDGTFEGGSADSTLRILKGSGTGSLKGLLERGRIGRTRMASFLSWSMS